MPRKYGWIDPTEHSPKSWLERSMVKDNLPESFSLDIGPDIFDQGSLGSCTSNAIVSAYSFLKKKIRPPTADSIYTTSKGSLRGQ